jgi:hypothetical protein
VQQRRQQQQQEEERRDGRRQQEGLQDEEEEQQLLRGYTLTQHARERRRKRMIKYKEIAQVLENNTQEIERKAQNEIRIKHKMCF